MKSFLFVPAALLAAVSGIGCTGSIGTGVPPGGEVTLSLSSTNQDFGTVAVGGSGPPFGFTVTDTGNRPATHVFLALASGTQFAVSASSCGAAGAPITIPAGGTCNFAVTFNPTSAGPQTDTAIVTYDGATAAKNVDATLSGAAISPTTEGIYVATDHPRLWWNATRLTQAQTWLSAHPFTPGASDYLNIAWQHVVAGTDCSGAVTWAAGFSVSPAECSPSANGADQARWYGEEAFLVYDWCFDQWTSPQRTTFQSNWNSCLTGINQQSWGGPDMTQSNYNWGNLRNDIEYGIATYWENTTAADVFLSDGITTRWTNHFVPVASGEAAGGVGQEGDEYASTIAQYPIIPFVTMGQGGRDIYDETGYFKEFAYWLVYGTTPAATVPPAGGGGTYQLNPFSDDELFVDGGILSLRSYYQDFMNLASNYWSAVNVGKHAREWVNTVGAAAMATDEFILAADAAPAATAFATLPLDYYATGIQYLYGRTAWDTSSSYFMWQLGQAAPGGGHSHLDVGNFNLWRGGRWLARETTGYSNTITGYGYKSRVSDGVDGILAHNGIVFGTALYTDDVGLMPSVNAGQAVVRRLESTAGYVYADVDLTNQYLWSSGYASYNRGAVVHVERELLFLRELETTVVFDRLTTGNVTAGPDSGVAAADEVTTFVIHFETNPTLEDATHLTDVNGAEALRMTTLVPVSPTRRVIDEQSCASCSANIGQYRVELDTAGTPQRYFLHVLQARDTSGSNVLASVVDSNSASSTAGTFTVTLHPSVGADSTIVLNKGQTSSGGTLALAGASPALLRTDVQTISYTDGGPVWN